MPTIPDIDDESTVGIWHMRVYIPSRYVRQSELEEHDVALRAVPSPTGSASSSSSSSSVSSGISSSTSSSNCLLGKYTVGLGQQAMAFVDPTAEDAVSMALTAVHWLLDDLLRPDCPITSTLGVCGSVRDLIARIDVGTESNPDGSKAIKTHLNALLPTMCAGSDCTNACFGGTAALLNALNWLEGAECRQQCRRRDVPFLLALVVCTDVAVYERASSARPTGGAGAVAMLVGPRAPVRIGRDVRYHCEHQFDFCRPQHSGYPAVDGALSLQCYLRAAERCCRERWGAGNHDYFVAHCPYSKLVQKACKHIGVPYERSEPTLRICTQAGNLYTASLYAALASLLQHVVDAGAMGRAVRALAFSYGSGLISCSFDIVLRQQDAAALRWCVQRMQLSQLLEDRVAVSPFAMDAAVYEHAPLAPIIHRPGVYISDNASSHGTAGQRYYMRIP